MSYLISIIIGYLLGCSSMSFYISKFKKIDIKGQGSKNYGASNTVMLVGKKAGALVFIHDFLKSAIAVCIAKSLFGDVCGALAGCASVIGHIYPFYLKFDGGKGFASFIGASIAMSPMYGILIFVGAILLAILFDYIVAATFSFISAMPVYFVFANTYAVAVIFFITALIIVYKHKENVCNLITKNGKESKISSVLLKKNKGGNK